MARILGLIAGLAMLAACGVDGTPVRPPDDTPWSPPEGAPIETDDKPGYF